MKRCLHSFWIAGVVSLVGCLAAVQQARGSLTVEGLDDAKLTFTLAQLRQMPQQSVSLANPHTKTVDKFAGVLLADLLAKAGAPAGDKLRGDEMRDYVEVTGSDGYRALFALAELDPAFQDNKVMVAITSDGKPLFCPQSDHGIDRGSAPRRNVRRREHDQ